MRFPAKTQRNAKAPRESMIRKFLLVLNLIELSGSLSGFANLGGFGGNIK